MQARETLGVTGESTDAPRLRQELARVNEELLEYTARTIKQSAQYRGQEGQDEQTRRISDELIPRREGMRRPSMRQVVVVMPRPSR